MDICSFFPSEESDTTTDSGQISDHDTGASLEDDTSLHTVPVAGIDSESESNTLNDTHSEAETDTNADTSSATHICDTGEETQRVCGADGNVHVIDECGDEMQIVHCASTNEICNNGICGCASGWTGEECKRCVDMYGGFAGNESHRQERDIEANETILSGDIGTSDDATDNAYHVVTGANHATIGGFTIRGGQADYSEGGGIYFYGAETYSVNGCTLIGNTSRNGGGIYSDQSANTTVINSIVWKNIATNSDWTGEIENDEIAASPSMNTVTHSNVQGGYAGSGNIDLDPRFINEDTGDFHLSKDSPCIDSGDAGALGADFADLDGDGNTGENTPVDADGNVREVGGNVDMGAFESSFLP